MLLFVIIFINISITIIVRVIIYYYMVLYISIAQYYYYYYIIFKRTYYQHITIITILLLYYYYYYYIIICYYIYIYIYYKSTCISSGSAQRLQVSAAADARRDGERPAASWIDLGVNFLEVKGRTVQLGVRYQYLLYIHDILYIIHIYLYIYIYLFMYIHARACIYSVERHVTVLWSLSKVMLWLCPVMYIELDRS